MKSKIIFSTLLILMAFTFTTCNTEKVTTVETIRENGSVIPVDGRVPNEETAMRIAEAVWLPIYGSLIYGSRPFKARLVDDSIWVVEGTLPEGSVGAGGILVGAVAVVILFSFLVNRLECENSGKWTGMQGNLTISSYLP